MKSFTKISALLMGVFSVLAGAPAAADDSEVFTNAATLATGVRPNVLFIVDTSGSMDTFVEGYDSSVTYTGPCEPDRVYWQTGNTRNPPACDSNQWVGVNYNRCRAAANGMASGGWWSGRTQMLITGVSPTRWDDAVAGRNTSKLECEGDTNRHGDLPGTTAAGGENKYARNGSGTSDANRWGNSGSSNRINWRSTAETLSLYSSNYMNFYYGGATGTPLTRLDIVRKAAKDLIEDLEGVNLGLMRYSTNAEGGMVTYPISELTAVNKVAMKAQLDTFLAAGWTPLSETMYEAHQYLSGGTVHFGATSTVGNNISMPSVAASRVGNTLDSTEYASPMTVSCQNTFIVYLTDGLPTEDNAADDLIEGLEDFDPDGGGACPAQIPEPEDGHETSGRCLQNLTRYMHTHDLRDGVIGTQTVTSYYVGFGSDIAKSEQYLRDVAAAGGGSAYTAEDAPGLAATLTEIFNEVVESTNTTFVSPAVSVNAFNRTQNFNDLFVSVFAPTKNRHWPGNLKKYRIIDGEIYGTSTIASAVDPDTGFFRVDAKAMNTPTLDAADGVDARAGGSAARLTGSNGWADGARNLYTYLGTEADLTNAENAVEVGNTDLTAAMVGAGDDDRRQDVIEFARGRDLNDDIRNGDVDEPRKRMGDPMHARPAIVVYSGTAEDPVGTVFTPTNDGYLHAFDMATGDELWAFIPPQYLPRLNTLLNNPPTVIRDYALDGDVRVFKYDVDQDGIVEPDDGDKVYLFFGTGRGGRAYYSLDVTDRASPVYRWRKSEADLPKLGRTWSTPAIARVNIDGSGQSDQKFVLIFGGGYDTGQDGYAYTTDSVGNAVFMLDLETGNLLWSASNSGADLNLTDMTHSIPAAISVMDTDGDRFADRMYASDMGGRIWRFDIYNGNAVSSLVTGGVLASLGGAAEGPTPPEAANRRFYNSPDAAPISLRGSRPFINIAIGSGYRGHPLETDTQDRFYSIRDYNPFTKRSNDSYTEAAVITDDDTGLVDITDNVNVTIPDGAKGWKIMFDRGGWRGEKVLADSVTASGVIFFPTFTPRDPDPATPCLARTANRVYAVYAASGRPFTRWNETRTGDLDADDRFVDLTQRGIAPTVSILANPSDPTGKGICQVGATILSRCVKFGTTVRSYWEHR